MSCGIPSTRATSTWAGPSSHTVPWNRSETAWSGDCPRRCSAASVATLTESKPPLSAMLSPPTDRQRRTACSSRGSKRAISSWLAQANPGGTGSQ